MNGWGPDHGPMDPFVPSDLGSIDPTTSTMATRILLTKTSDIDTFDKLSGVNRGVSIGDGVARNLDEPLLARVP